MFKHGKFYVSPPENIRDFNDIFRELALSGAGQPVDKEGIAIGQWTPELLTKALSDQDDNEAGIELRTVQNWFQQNNKTPNPANIDRLAKIFGCGDPEATSEWRKALSDSRTLSAKQRRKLKDQAEIEQKEEDENDGVIQNQRFSLAKTVEALFSRPSPLDLPATVFAGAVALGFLSYITDIHSITFERFDGITKQVGFLWAPNWTILFMLVLPMFLIFTSELLNYWKNEGRTKLLTIFQDNESKDWVDAVQSSSITYWAVLILCLPFAGVLQWLGVRLSPLLTGDGDFAKDWGTIALVRPDITSVPEAIVFTGLAYLYMSLCFFVFFVGLILHYTAIQDFWKVCGNSVRTATRANILDVHYMGNRLMQSVFRCTIAGVMIAICMKLQSFYVTSSGQDILTWLISDAVSVFTDNSVRSDRSIYSIPTHYSSLIVAISSCVPFVYGSIRFGKGSPLRLPLAHMGVVIGLLVFSYLMIDGFAGFSLLLSLSIIIACLGLIDPRLGRPKAPKTEDVRYVS